MGISLKPSEAVAGGLKTENADLTWKKVRFEMWGYPGKDGSDTQEKSPALMITYGLPDGDEQVQAYSVGKSDRYTIINGGKGLDGNPLTKSCNATLLLDALVNAGFPENKIGDDISILDGLVAHHIGQPVKDFKTGQAKVDDQGRPKTISIPSTIIKLPWEKKAGAKGAVKAGGTDVTAKTVKIIADQIDANDGEAVTRAALTQAVFKVLKADPDKDAVAGLIYSPAIKAALAEAGMTLDGENVSKN